MMLKKNNNMLKKYLDTKTNESSRFVYIKHINNNHIHKIPFSTAIHSKLIRDTILENMTRETYGKLEINPMIINNNTSITNDSMIFIINYMTYYDNNIETAPPDAPIKNIHISLIIGDDYKLFNDIYVDKSSLKKKIITINELMIASKYFDVKYLDKKLCAIIASLLQNASINEINTISQ